MTDGNDDLSSLSLPEQEALGLADAAINLDRARASANRAEELVAALNHNLEIWVAIRSLAQSPSCPLPPDVRANLIRLSEFTAQTTFANGAAISDSSLNTLININLQLAEGLLEGQKAKAGK
jgi:flagellar biosynthesis regulator FlaF